MPSKIGRVGKVDNISKHGVQAFPNIPPGSVLALESRSLWNLSPNDLVGFWPDISGTAHHAVQATTSAKPTYRLAGSLPVVEFDGVDDVFLHVVTLPSTATIVYVSIPLVSYASTTSNSKYIARGEGDIGLGVYTGDSGEGSSVPGWGAKVHARYTDGTADYYNGPVNLQVGMPYTFGIAVDGAGGDSWYGREVYRNRVLVKTLHNTDLRIGSNANHRLVAFYAWSRRLSTLEYQQVYDYVSGWMAGYGVILT